MNTPILTPDKAFYRLQCETSHLDFTRYFFKHRQQIKFIINWHHHVVADSLEKVMTGEIENLIINVPPGSSKTEMAVINFIARGLAKTKGRARFLHLSYSEDLALTNSQAAKDLVESDEFQELWPLPIAPDQKAKGRWNVIIDGKKAGGVYATSIGGQITGFRAGHMAPGFQGAIIIDDPLKPEDAWSKPKLNSANRKLLTTVKSRKANPKTPIIVIMQRIAERDPTQFLLDGNLPGKWTHIKIPAVMDDESFKKLDKKYQSMVVKGTKTNRGRFSYWPYKEPLSELLEMERGNAKDKEGSKVSRHTFASQYQQHPVAIGGNIIRSEYFSRYKVLPPLSYRKIFVDTAQKTKERNDYSVFECWGKGVDGRTYLIDLIRGKWEAPELRRRAKDFWIKHAERDGDAIGALRQMVVEDKSSGTGLIQDIKWSNTIPVLAMPRVKDKLTRVMDIVSYIESGMVVIPEEADFVSDFLQECEAFTADDTHAHDDMIDPMCDAINDMLSTGSKLNQWAKLAKG